MDAQILGTVIGLIAYAVVLTAGVYKLMRGVETSLREEMKVMHKDQDERIKEAEREAKEIRNNYNVKFQKVYDVVHEVKSDVIEAVHTLENNMRDSNHNLAENITKALNKLEMRLAGMEKREQ